jgi:hypothetical protein
MKPHRSNCHLEAWRALRRGEAAHICLRPTKYSRLERVVRNPLMTPVRWLGMALQWVAWPLTHVGEVLRTGHWYHVLWVDKRGNAWEFVPHGPKRLRLAPPLVFVGHVRRADPDDDGCA